MVTLLVYTDQWVDHLFLTTPVTVIMDVSVVLSYVLRVISSSLIPLSIGLVVAYLVKFYLNDVKSYPPGPLPLPLLGNLLLFSRKGDKHPYRVILDLRQKYGPIFTFWMGSDPSIIVADSKLAREALISYHFGGRPVFKTLNEIFFLNGSTDIIIADWGRPWEILRKVSHSAIRKFAVNDKLPVMAHKSLEIFFDEIKSREGNQPFNPESYVTFLITCLITAINFDEYLTMDHPDFIEQSRAADAQVNVSNKMILIDKLPVMKYVWRKEWQELLHTIKVQIAYLDGQLKRHEVTYQEGKIRDFTDAMIFAQKEAEAENDPDLVHLKRDNIIMAISDVYGAGTETTKLTLLWLILFMAKYPHHQKALREEVDSVIGDSECPSHEHRGDCHFVQAFISEVMRIRPIAPLNVPHKTIVNTELGGHRIKKDTTVMMPVIHFLKDPEIWADPEEFKPDRFLTEDGKYNAKPNNYFLPFSAGRRVCLGEKLANANVFFLLTGLLQQTKGKMITVPGEIDLSFDPDHAFNGRPRPYKMKIVDEAKVAA